MCAELIVLMRVVKMGVIRSINTFYNGIDNYETKQVGWYKPHHLRNRLRQFFHDVIPRHLNIYAIQRIHFDYVCFNRIIIYLSNRLKFKS